MKQRIYVVCSKTKETKILAKNRNEAWAKFWKSVADEKTPLSELGNIVILKDQKQEYPFRTVPLLWQMKLIDKDMAISNIMACTSVSQKEAEQMLMDYSFKDSRLIPLIDKLRQNENK
jgi:hypothetical protein